jgi:hypothetical protein
MNYKLIKLNGTEIKPSLKNIKLELSKIGIQNYSKIQYIASCKSFVWSGSTKLWKVDGTNINIEWTIQNNQIGKNWINETAREIWENVKNDFLHIRYQTNT